MDAIGRASRQEARHLTLFAVLFSSALGTAAPSAGAAAEIVIDFETATIGKPVTSWTEQEVVFTLAHEPRQSKAAGRVMFFPHLATQRKGILCAMATEPIPVRAQFPRAATTVTVVLWGSTGCAALLEAFDESGAVVAAAALPAVPARAAPADPVPFCELSVTAPAIAYIQFSGPRAGEFLAADEVRYSSPPPQPR
jgi:hypothetical protein